MPTDPRRLPPLTFTRRGALTSALVVGAGVLAGCTDQGAPAPTPASTQPAAAPDPDVALAARVLRQEEDVLAAVRATLERHPGLHRTLAPVRSTHHRHVRLLARAVPEHAAAGASAARAVHVPHDRRRAVRRLARQEDELSLGDKRASFAAESGVFAQLLASMAGAAAQHAAALRGASG